MAKGLGLGRGLGLGKGLESLLGPEANDNASQQAASCEIDINLIDANPWQPRVDFKQDDLDELANSIRSVGIIQPLTLRKIEETGRYQIIAGERRFRAAKIVGLQTVPAYIREVSDDKMLAVALIENIQRADLNPIEEAQSYQRLIDECNLTQETLADQVGKKRSTVTNYLRLLKLPEDIRNGLRDKVISMGHARAIMGVEDEETQLMLFHETIEQGYSVRRIEEMVREYNGNSTSQTTDTTSTSTTTTNNKSKQKAQTPEEYKALSDQLASYFGTKVKLACTTSGKGKITIPFASTEELERIMEILDSTRQSKSDAQ